MTTVRMLLLRMTTAVILIDKLIFNSYFGAVWTSMFDHLVHRVVHSLHWLALLTLWLMNDFVWYIGLKLVFHCTRFVAKCLFIYFPVRLNLFLKIMRFSCSIYIEKVMESEVNCLFSAGSYLKIICLLTE